MTLKAQGLNTGDGIGVMAPAGPVFPEAVRKGMELLESRGFRVHPAPHLFDRKGYLAGEDDVRARDLLDLFEDPSVKAILCARGGYGTLRILDKIDYGLISRNPKILVGYSDITALLLALYEKTGLVTFHGPMVTDLGRKAARNLDGLLSLLSSHESFPPVRLKGPVIRPGKTKGVLLGGNLALLCHMVGTPFMPTLDGAVLFLEETGEAPYRIDRMITQLKLGGYLEGLSGLLLGEFSNCGSAETLFGIFRDTFSDHRIPIIAGLPVGHGLENILLPVGIEVALDTEKKTLRLLESGILS
ncbi:MAG: LD-carboxypeptidase [Deltaproteobacteria bacterium]|nr:LD-carboxypeptidase [Deltaproteobacteria bacterium]MBW2016591.1 LD-carboxypeptidase [Deltaproteobacteria bacterium]MBW2129502.1 LD-carboxypeptidase [Deltaproteobacteria bacterium]MBW2304815.1 LD-carboxypeptidase [Deltaproteobacteria bacterium]